MIHRRCEFSKDTKRQAFARSKGICECHLIAHVFSVPCSRPLGEGNTFYEHIIPDRSGGDNSLSNCAALTKTCWSIKTAIYDHKANARVRKREDRHRGIRPAPSIPGNRFDPRKRTLRGQVVDRATGEPWRSGR